MPSRDRASIKNGPHKIAVPLDSFKKQRRDRDGTLENAWFRMGALPRLKRLVGWRRSLFPFRPVQPFPYQRPHEGAVHTRRCLAVLDKIPRVTEAVDRLLGRGAEGIPDIAEERIDLCARTANVATAAPWCWLMA
jgi:hypothetical protein